MRKIIIIVIMLVILLLASYNANHNQNGFAVFEVYDDLDGKPITNANIVTMNNEKVFTTDTSGSSVIKLDLKPDIPKEFLGYSAIVFADGYLPMVVYNVGVYPAESAEQAKKYKIKLKKPEPLNNASYYTEFLPISNVEMAEIIEYYKRLIKH